MAAEYPDIPVHPSILALVPVIAERREAVTRVLAAGRTRWNVPNLAGDTTGGTSSDIWRLYQLPPSEAEDAAARAEVAAAADGWRELHRTEFAFVSEDDRRAAFAAACQSGDWSAIRTAWYAWVGPLAAADNRASERDRLAVVLCVSPSSQAGQNRWEPGAPTGVRYGPGGNLTGSPYGFPSFAVELARAMDTIPATLPDAVPVAAREPVAASKNGKHAGTLASINAMKAAARTAASIGED